MVLPLWGQLEKAQDDPQTIEEAMAAAIVAHEADPTAHLGAGESLEQHKKDSILDHPAESVVTDKQPFSIYDEVQTFRSTSNWSIDLGSALTNDGRWISVSLFSQSAFAASSFLPFTSTAAYPLKDLLFSFDLRMVGAASSDGQARIFFAIDNDPANLDQVAFLKEGTQYKWIIKKAGTVVHTHVLGTGGVVDAFYTIFFDSIQQEIVLYENGTKVSTYATADWHDLILPTFNLDMSRSSNKNIFVRIRNWKARYNLFT